jgi:hypothetical protein
LRRIDMVGLIRYVARNSLEASGYFLLCVANIQVAGALIAYCRNWQPGVTISAPAELFQAHPRTVRHTTKHMTRLIEFAPGVLFSADVLSADWFYVATGRAIPFKTDSERVRAFTTAEVSQKTSGALPEQLDLL